MRLIDADALETDTEYDIYMDDFMSYSREEIRMAPAIDAVPVVRCKDCKHSGKGILGVMHCKFDMRVRRDDWFCADGERKGGKDE